MYETSTPQSLRLWQTKQFHRPEWTARSSVQSWPDPQQSPHQTDRSKSADTEGTKALHLHYMSDLL